MNLTIQPSKLILGLALLTSVTLNLHAEPPSMKIEPQTAIVESFPDPTNAALVYWRAFASMPKLTAEDQALFKALGKKANESKTPLDQTGTARLVKNFSTSLATLHRAVLIPECDWGIEYSRGPKGAVPHFSKAMDLARVAALRARLRLAEGKTGEAIGDLHAIMQLSRHSAQNSHVLIGALVEISIDAITVYTIASDFSKFDNKALENLAIVMDAIPPRIKMIKAIQGEEKIMVGWAQNEFNAARNNPPKFAELQQTFVEMLQLGNGTGAAEILNVPAFKTPEAFGKSVDIFARDFKHLVELLALPYEEAETKADAFLHGIPERRNESPLSAFILPSFTGLLSKEMQAEMQSAMLRAAIAIRLHGLEAIATIQDPLTHEPFEYHPVEGGFELKSKALLQQKPVSLIFSESKPGDPPPGKAALPRESPGSAG